MRRRALVSGNWQRRWDEFISEVTRSGSPVGGIDLQIASLSASTIRFNDEIKAYEIVFRPDWFGKDGESVDPRRPGPLLEVRQRAHRYGAVALLRYVRGFFPYIAVVFRDGNLQDDIFIKVDIEPIRERVELLTVTGPSPLLRETGKTTQYLIANFGTDDLLTLTEGFEEEFPPAVFLFCGNSEPLSSEEIVDAVKNSSKWDDLISGLLNVGELVLHPGPDADYFVILSSAKPTLKRILKCNSRSNAGND